MIRFDVIIILIVLSNDIIVVNVLKKIKYTE